MSEKEYHGAHKLFADRLGVRRGEMLYTFITCLLALAVSGLAAYLLKQPLLFPSLGPTALLFFEQPMAPASSPRNTLIGHLVAILAGALSLAMFGLLDAPSVLVEGVTLARVGAGAFSVALTGVVLLLLRSSHPPTGATASSASRCRSGRPKDEAAREASRSRRSHGPALARSQVEAITWPCSPRF